ncbi:hypothetical protein FRX31_030066 [Thalictrum thalictroides]|uniref:Uncharacterized protein n=1 Tax=Thalictrum thalictroides TaxID=46969 RepID=A0A7J6V6G0_THATH|nr:hypothetical protein FRX31_030066 [Thalictrum thalictroides]
MAIHDSDKHGSSPSRSGRSALPPTHSDCCQKDGDSSSPLGRSSLTPGQLATVRSQDSLWYRLRRDRLSAEAFYASNVGLLLPRPVMTAQLQHHLHSEVRCLGISSSDISVNSHTNSINIDFPQDSSSAMPSAQLHEVMNIFDINFSRDWTSFQIPVDVLHHHQDSASLEIPVDVLHPHQAFTVLKKTHQQIQYRIFGQPQQLDDVQINVHTLTLQDMLST